MKKQRFFTNLKKMTPILFVILSVLFFVLLFISKDKLTNIASRAIKLEVDSNLIKTETVIIDALYNYSKNEKPYKITFLEFGSTGCSACKRMEKVLVEIQQKYPEKVNVVFVNVTFRENHDLMKYFGIVTIPTQVLLNKEGKEYFRNTGYFSTKELANKFMY